MLGDYKKSFWNEQKGETFMIKLWISTVAGFLRAPKVSDISKSTTNTPKQLFINTKLRKGITPRLLFNGYLMVFQFVAQTTASVVPNQYDAADKEIYIRYACMFSV